MRLFACGSLLVSAALSLGGCGDSSPATTMTTTTKPGTPEGTAFLVESIPLNSGVVLTPGARNTWEVLITFVNQATTKIDLTSMYWDLNATNKPDQGQIFSEAQFEAFGAAKGRELLEALSSAAARGVKLRTLCGTGISGSDPGEIEEIRKLHPNNVEIRVWDADDWYGSGIMHQKIWIFDDTRLYLGSANNDWLSLTQVKEMGVALQGEAGFAAVQDLQKYFDRWWFWLSPSDGPPKQLAEMFDSSISNSRDVPCWEADPKDPDAASCANPFPGSTTTAYNLQNPMRLELNGSAGGSFFSCSPPAVCDVPTAVNPMYGVTPSGREWDGSALIQTIMSANKSVCLSVMDYIPSTLYVDDFPPAFWPGLNDALVAKARQGTNVRMLISHWNHSKAVMWRYLQALNATAEACADSYNNPCQGVVEIREYALAGWNMTAGADEMYPPFSRVNHAKYIVTDQRFNIGTSNMVWGYFYNTAGSSFNSDHAGLRAQLQAAFDRDWSSAYASPLQPVELTALDVAVV